MSSTKLLITLTLTLVAGCETPAAVGKVTPVEVWRVGDDVLTSSFRDALESAFDASPEFAPSAGKVPGTLVVTIPTHLEWRQINGETEVTYSVEFANRLGQVLGRSKGTCLKSRLVECVAAVLKDARATRAKLP